ncbi:MAG TPA: SRPBCC family protein [Euzebyales bacterium]|nr:SRPBCC family protein [Euzebyales bacterium]
MSEAVAESIEINATPRAVMDVIVDIEAYPEWQKDIREVAVLERDAAGRPTQARFVVDARLLTAIYTLAYTYSDDGVRWQLVSSEQLRQLDGGYRVVATADDATTVTYELIADPTISVPSFMRRRAAEHIVRSALDGLKQRVEAGV